MNEDSKPLYVIGGVVCDNMDWECFYLRTWFPCRVLCSKVWEESFANSSFLYMFVGKTELSGYERRFHAESYRTFY